MARVVRFRRKGGPEVLQIEEVDVAPPADDEVQIRVEAIGINRAESMFRSGPYAEDAVFPARLGYEAAGTVSALGRKVKSFDVGDAVSVIPPMSITRYGSYGEFANFPARVVVKHPASLSWIEAAAIWMQYVTAYGALIDIAGIAANDHVLITAASSSVGLAAIQMANAVGAIPIAITRSSAKRKRLEQAGAAHVIASQEEDLPARVASITGGRGARVAFDPVAGPELEIIAQAMAQNGLIIEYGALSPDPTPLPLFPVLVKNLRLQGYLYKEVTRDDDSLEKAKAFILQGLTQGKLKPIIDRVFPFEEIVEAHRYLESNVQFGKIVVTV
jgi:NADPH:quinone reductase